MFSVLLFFAFKHVVLHCILVLGVCIFRVEENCFLENTSRQKTTIINSIEVHFSNQFSVPY